MKHLSRYIDDCRNLDEDSFSDKHGKAFLVTFHPAGSLRSPSDAPHKTITMEAVETSPGTHQPQADLLVFPLRQNEENPLDFFSVGRTNLNDVFIPDDSVSIFHAVFISKNDGRFFIQDASSTNGTALNDTPVPAQGSGKPLELDSGARIRFGLVELSFLKPGAFRELVLGLASD